MKEPYLDGLPTALAFYDPKESCWRMSQATLLSDLPESLQSLPAWGMTAAGELYELQTPERLINGRDCLYGRNLPTPTARDYKDHGPNINWERGKNRNILPGTIMSLLSDDGNK